MLDKPRILFFSPTRLINSIKHEHSCKILYVQLLLSSFYLVNLYHSSFKRVFSFRVENSVDPEQMASSETI